MSARGLLAVRAHKTRVVTIRVVTIIVTTLIGVATSLPRPRAPRSRKEGAGRFRSAPGERCPDVRVGGRCAGIRECRRRYLDNSPARCLSDAVARDGFVDILHLGKKVRDFPCFLLVGEGGREEIVQ